MIATLTLIASAITLAALAYVVFAIRCIIAFGRRQPAPGEYSPLATVLKPVCGMEPELYENLRSFCDQNYADYQVVFGARDARDPAIAVINRIIEEFPQRDLSLVVDETVIGTNLKVSILACMLRLAKHDLIVVADSDMRVERNYLRALVAPFQDRQVGAVTCLYKGTPAPGLPSRLGAMFINDCFAPSVLVALSFQELRFCFGATMAVTRKALEASGGFAALADQLADDHILGRRVAQQGLKVVLSAYLVENRVWEPSLAALFQHELRWARTIRAMQPVGFTFSFVSYPVAVSLLFFLLLPSAVGLTAVAVSVILRVLLHRAVHVNFDVVGRTAPWLAPVRDLLSFLVWAASFFGRSVEWRKQQFSVRSDGKLMNKGVRNS
ncbi:MAG TPA: bacteriohopanetetrol glucosamine biosynthesis glycosyltransferase HpnI [Burkholderiales bacterium]|nr:bacteriohopanetetrol glucosamine biosynthesis glycosyltransferase HpnI [Burkholderiales bacterium]